MKSFSFRISKFLQIYILLYGLINNYRTSTVTQFTIIRFQNIMHILAAQDTKSRDLAKTGKPYSGSCNQREIAECGKVDPSKMYKIKVVDCFLIRPPVDFILTSPEKCIKKRV